MHPHRPRQAAVEGSGGAAGRGRRCCRNRAPVSGWVKLRHWPARVPPVLRRASAGAGAGPGGGGGPGCPAVREASVPQLKEFKISTCPYRIRCWISFARHRLPAAGRRREGREETGFRALTHSRTSLRAGEGAGPAMPTGNRARTRGKKGPSSSSSPRRPPLAAPAAPVAREEARAGARDPEGGTRAGRGRRRARGPCRGRGGRPAPAHPPGGVAPGWRLHRFGHCRKVL